MDKPTTPAGPDAAKFPWPEDSGSEGGLGATGVFGVVNEPAAAEGWSAGPGAEAERQRDFPTEAAKPQPALGAQALAEPVVHRVVFGGGAEEGSTQLLDRIRLASAEREPSGEKAPARESGAKGSAGFTELLRTLASDKPAPATAAREIPAQETRPPASASGFTSLLQTLSATEATTAPASDAIRTMQPAVPPIPAEFPRVAAGPTPGGFTELLRTTASEGSEFGEPAGAIPPPTENKPGTFTQLFSTFDAGSGPAAPVPSDRERAGSSGGSAGSFTRMLSLEEQPVAAEPAYREERQALPGSVDYGLTPGTVEPSTPNRDPFSQPLPEAQPVPGTPPVAGVGITRLIQMLDEPSRPAAPPMEIRPVSPAQGEGPGVWTQTLASLATPIEPARPAAKTPEWAPQQPQQAGGAGYPSAREAQFPTPLNEPAPQVAPAASGPSEFTRILDASRLREMAMRGGQIPAAVNPVPAPPAAPSFAAPVAPSFAPPPTAVPMPSYPVAPPLPPAGMQGLRGMPPAGGFVPPPQAPAMYVPPMPAPPPVPQALPIKPVDPGAGKLQQFVPILLVLIIVLLVVLLVTVIFLLKH